MNRLIFIVALVGITGYLHTLPAQQPSLRPPGSGADEEWRANAEPGFTPRRLMRPLSPITEFKVRQVTEALTELKTNELVLAVSIDDAHRAYPINMLTGPSREIINDTLGGRPLAATW